MSLTVEVMNNRINTKFKYVLEVLTKIRKELNEHKQDPNIREYLLKFNKYYKEVDKLKKTYLLSVVIILNKYYSESQNDDSINNEFYMTVDSNNIIHTLDLVIKKIKSEYAKVESKIKRKKEINMGFHEIGKISININNKENSKSDNMCHCGGQIEYNQATNEMKCAFCSLVLKLDTANYVNNDTKLDKPKKNNHNPSGYFKTWIDSVQGKKQKNITEKDMIKIKAYISNTVLNINNVYQVRSTLKATGLSTHNMQAPAIYKMINADNYLPIFTDEQINTLMYWFSVVKKYWAQLYDKNLSQYPYCLFKFEELMYVKAKEAKDRDAMRELKISMRFTYLQSAKTTINNDLMFKAVCEKINEDEKSKEIEFTGIRYMPTNINKYL